MSKNKSVNSSSSSSSLSSDAVGVSLLHDRWSKRRSLNPLNPAKPEKASTQQQFKDECDMNLIVKNAQRGIEPKYYARGVPRFGDFSEIPDLTSAYNQIKAAEEAFAELPAALRAELGNDPKRIDSLTREQAKRFNLLLVDPETPSPAVPTEPKAKSSPKAGQAATGGTEPPSTD